MTPDKQVLRRDLLSQLGQEVHEELLKAHCAEGHDAQEIVFRAEKIPALVDKYSYYLEAYRERHIGKGNVRGDKIAAFTGILIMREWLFESATGHINSPYAEFSNETFAIRCAQLFVQKSKFGFKPDEYRQLTHCFAECCEDDNCMNTWAVAVMAMHMDSGNSKEPEYVD